MEYLQIFILAVVQAFTEFLPVSSSGHLVFFQQVFGMKEPKLLLDIMLHVGTLLAVIVYFAKDLLNIIFDGVSALVELVQGNKWSEILYRNPNLKLFLYVLFGTVPAGLVGVFFKDQIEIAFGSLLLVAIGFLFTAFIVYLTHRSSHAGRNLYQLTLRDALWIGIAQAVAILPGVSRSGMTIATGLTRGLSSDLAFRFSFILSIPAVLGAFLLEAPKLNGISQSTFIAYLGGTLVSFLLGLFVIRILSKIVIRGNFFLFYYYCAFMGFLTLILSFVL